MDTETLTLLADSVRAWASDQSDFFEQLEHSNAELPTVLTALQELGLLNLIAEDETRHDMQALSAVLYELAQHSASVAVLVAQQNMAHWLLAECQQSLPVDGCIALPMFDTVVEWPHQGLAFRDVPMLNQAQQVLLPVKNNGDNNFKLLLLTREQFKCSADIVKLGLRALPQADIKSINKQQQQNVIGQGQELFVKVQALWSQMEIAMLAIRSGIAHASYNTALAYAKERYQGGKIIIEHSLIQKMLADFYKEQQIMDSTWQQLAANVQPYQMLTAGQQALALAGAEKLPWLCSDGIQILGGIGYMEDFPQERRYRDGKHCEFLLGHPQARSFALWSITYAQ